MKISFLLCILIMACPLLGNIHPKPGHFAAAGEYLYFFNGSDQAYFATQVAGPGETALIPDDQRYANEQRWHSGYRAELAYGFCCTPSYLQVRGTWIPKFSESRTVQGSLFSAQGQGIISEAGSQHVFTSISETNTFTYYAIDGFYSHNIYCSRCFALDLQEGIEFSNIGFITHQALVDPTIAHKWNNRSQNIGPTMALASHLNLGRRVSFEFTGTSSVLVSRKSASLSFVNPSLPEFTSLFDDHRWFVILAYDLRAGLQYSFNICRFCVNVEAGYEILCYFKGLERISLIDGPNFFATPDGINVIAATGFSHNEYFNFAMHGLYVQAGISF